MVLNCPVYQLVYNTRRQTYEKETVIAAKSWKCISTD